MRLLIAETAHLHYRQLLTPMLTEQGVELELVGGHDEAELVAHAGECAVWFGQPDLLAKLLRAGHKPLWLQSTWAGITPLLAGDLPRDYRLTRAVGIFGQVMAEYVLCHVLAHERNLQAQQRDHIVRHWHTQLPQSLAGRKLLIVGCGEIGQRVAELLAPFGIELFGVASQSRKQPPFVHIAGINELADAAASVDYVLNLLPDTPATHDIYTAEFFASLQPHALFLNAGRGAAVVDAHLVAALQAGQLAGAVIDVCREEPLPANHPFWTAPHLLLTGHTSAPTQPRLMAQLFMQNLLRWQRGEPLQGLVDFARGY